MKRRKTVFKKFMSILLTTAMLMSMLTATTASAENTAVSSVESSVASSAFSAAKSNGNYKNLLKNPDFEQEPSPDEQVIGWELSENIADGGICTDEAKKGTRSLKISGVPSEEITASQYNEITAAQTDTLIFSGWVKASSEQASGAQICYELFKPFVTYMEFEVAFSS